MEEAGVLLVRRGLFARWSSLSLKGLAFLANYIELIARQPTDQFDLRSRLRSEFITERSQLCIARKIHPREELIGRLMIAVLQVVVLLSLTPSLVMSFEFQSLRNGKTGSLPAPS